MTTSPNPVSIEATATTPVSVELCDGLPTTTSLDVAKHFGKQHKDVIKRINSLDCSREFYERNFAPIQIDTDLGLGRTRKDPAFRMTRDGFTFLCMGFTGKEAAKWKEAYIVAFNTMEQALRAQPVQQDERALLRFAIRTLELMRDRQTNQLPRLSTEEIVQHYLNVESLDRATPEQVKQALTFIQGQIIGEGNAAKVLPGIAGSSIAKDLLYGLLRTSHDAEILFNALYDQGLEVLASEHFKQNMAGKLAETSRQARDLLGYIASHAARDPFQHRAKH